MFNDFNTRLFSKFKIIKNEIQIISRRISSNLKLEVRKNISFREPKINKNRSSLIRSSYDFETPLAKIGKISENKKTSERKFCFDTANIHSSSYLGTFVYPPSSLVEILTPNQNLFLRAWIILYLNENWSYKKKVNSYKRLLGDYLNRDCIFLKNDLKFLNKNFDICLTSFNNIYKFRSENRRFTIDQSKILSNSLTVSTNPMTLLNLGFIEVILKNSQIWRLLSSKSINKELVDTPTLNFFLNSLSEFYLFPGFKIINGSEVFQELQKDSLIPSKANKIDDNFLYRAKGFELTLNDLIIFFSALDNLRESEDNFPQIRNGFKENLDGNWNDKFKNFKKFNIPILSWLKTKSPSDYHSDINSFKIVWRSFKIVVREIIYRKGVILYSFFFWNNIWNLITDLLDTRLNKSILDTKLVFLERKTNSHSFLSFERSLYSLPIRLEQPWNSWKGVYFERKSFFNPWTFEVDQRWFEISRFGLSWTQRYLNKNDIVEASQKSKEDIIQKELIDKNNKNLSMKNLNWNHISDISKILLAHPEIQSNDSIDIFKNMSWYREFLDSSEKKLSKKPWKKSEGFFNRDLSIWSSRQLKRTSQTGQADDMVIYFLNCLTPFNIKEKNSSILDEKDIFIYDFERKIFRECLVLGCFFTPKSKPKTSNSFENDYLVLNERESWRKLLLFDQGEKNKNSPDSVGDQKFFQKINLPGYLILRDLPFIQSNIQKNIFNVKHLQSRCNLQIIWENKNRIGLAEGFLSDLKGKSINLEVFHRTTKGDNSFFERMKPERSDNSNLIFKLFPDKSLSFFRNCLIINLDLIVDFSIKEIYYFDRINKLNSQYWCMTDSSFKNDSLPFILWPYISKYQRLIHPWFRPSMISQSFQCIQSIGEFKDTLKRLKAVNRKIEKDGLKKFFRDFAIFKIKSKYLILKGYFTSNVKPIEKDLTIFKEIDWSLRGVTAKEDLMRSSEIIKLIIISFKFGSDLASILLGFFAKELEKNYYSDKNGNINSEKSDNFKDYNVKNFETGGRDLDNDKNEAWSDSTQKFKYFQSNLTSQQLKKKYSSSEIIIKFIQLKIKEKIWKLIPVSPLLSYVFLSIKPKITLNAKLKFKKLPLIFQITAIIIQGSGFDILGEEVSPGSNGLPDIDLLKIQYFFIFNFEPQDLKRDTIIRYFDWNGFDPNIIDEREIKGFSKQIWKIKLAGIPEKSSNDPRKAFKLIIFLAKKQNSENWKKITPFNFINNLGLFTHLPEFLKPKF